MKNNNFSFNIKHILKVKYIQSYRKYYYLAVLAKVYDSLKSLDWRTSPIAISHKRKLISLQNKYIGKRCFIIGNGPSLNKTDLTKLRKEFTFGLNRFYLLKNKCGFYPTFLVAVNPLVISQCYKEIRKVPSLKFLNWKCRSKFKSTQNTIFIRSLVEQKFSTDVTRGIWEGATVTYVAMQLAYYMGFSKVILIGVDHNFKTKGQPHKKVVSDGSDDDHFSDKYFGKGFKWNLPDLKTSEYAYKLAKKAFEKDGREIYDATEGGSLKVYKIIKYLRLFK